MVVIKGGGDSLSLVSHFCHLPISGMNTFVYMHFSVSWYPRINRHPLVCSEWQWSCRHFKVYVPVLQTVCLFLGVWCVRHVCLSIHCSRTSSKASVSNYSGPTKPRKHRRRKKNRKRNNITVETKESKCWGVPTTVHVTTTNVPVVAPVLDPAEAYPVSSDQSSTEDDNTMIKCCPVFCLAACSPVLLCVAACSPVLLYVAACSPVLLCVTVCSPVLLCVDARKHVAVYDMGKWPNQSD